MTDPRTYLFRMLIVLAITGLIIAALFEPLRAAFSGNPFLNGVIISTAFIGVAFIFRQILRLAPEARWLAEIQKTNKISRSAPKPVLLATVHVMLSDSNEEGHLSLMRRYLVCRQPFHHLYSALVAASFLVFLTCNLAKPWDGFSMK